MISLFILQFKLNEKLNKNIISSNCIEIIKQQFRSRAQMSVEISNSIDDRQEPLQQIKSELQEICLNLSRKYDGSENVDDVQTKPNDKIKIFTTKTIADKQNFTAQKKKTVKILDRIQGSEDNDGKSQLSLLKIRSNEQSSNQQLERAPSLRKIRRNFSTDSNFQEKKFEESASSLMRKVKFEEIVTDDEQIEGERTNKRKFDANKFYEKLKIDGLDQSKVEKQSFMSYLCSLIRPRKRQSTKIQKKLMKLVDIKTTGTKEEVLMIKNIFESLLSEKIDGNQPSQRWKKIGFVACQPLKELEILVLLQWYNFTVQHRSEAIRLLNFCVQMDCSLFNFHKQATEVFCQRVEQGQIKGSTWKDYQECYNGLVIKSISEIFEKSKQGVANMQTTMIEILFKCGKNMRRIRQASIKKVEKQKSKK